MADSATTPPPPPGKPPNAAATAPLPFPGKAPDAPATAPLQAPGKSPAATATTPTKMVSPSTSNKKRKGKPKLQTDSAPAADVPDPKKRKLPTDHAPATEVPVPKKPKVKSAPNPAAKKTVEARTTTSKPRRSRGAVAAVVAVATAARSVVQTLDSAVADAGSADPPRQDVDADGQTTKQQAFGEFGCVEHLDKVDETIRSLFNAYSTQMGGSSQVETHGDDVQPACNGQPWSDWRAYTSAKNQVNNEYERYLHDDLFPCDDESFDILNWWKMHASKYPILAAMARDILAATASTVPCESAFSISGRVVNDHRTRLAGSTVDALLCFQDWLRTAGSSYLDIISIDSLSEDLADEW